MRKLETKKSSQKNTVSKALVPAVKKEKPNINFEEFGPNIEKYLKKNRQIDMRKLNKENNASKKKEKTVETLKPVVKKKEKIVPSEKKRQIDKASLDLEEFGPNIKKYLKKNRQIDMRKLVPAVKKKEKKKELLDLDEFRPNIEKYLKKNRQIDIRKVKTKKKENTVFKTLAPAVIKKKKKSKDKLTNIDLEEFAPNIEKYLRKNRQIDIRKLKNSDV